MKKENTRRQILKGSKFYDLYKPGAFTKLLSKFPIMAPYNKNPSLPAKFKKTENLVLEQILGMSIDGGAGSDGFRGVK